MPISPPRLARFRAAALLIALLLGLGAINAEAQSGPARANHIDARLVAESTAPAPGKDTRLAIAMRPEEGWHGYFENPGDAGLGMQLDWDLPPGVTVGLIHYPVPTTLVIAGLMNYVYEEDYAPLVDLTLDPSIAPGTPLPIRVKAQWLACTDEICVPEQAELGIDLVAGDGSVAPATTGLFDAWRAKLPAPLGSPATFLADGKSFRLSVPLPAAAKVADPYFFILDDKVLDYAAPQRAYRDGDRLILETAGRGAGPDAIQGLLKIGPGIGLWVEAKRGPVTVAGTLLTPETAESAPGSDGDRLILLVGALGGALLGGLLLNIMPCVFPILSLKAISLAKAGGDGAAARREALAYTAGVLLVCVGLGALLLAFRALGEQIGWAFQLQDPRIVLLLMLLVTAIAFNLAGLFEVPGIGAGSALAARGGPGGAFWTGALAAFVATPCTAPFMAGAIGTALLLPTIGALLVFAGLGLGLALPFLLIAYVPALRTRLPRPGAWMDRFRRIMAVPMFLTALWLAWVLGRQTGVDGLLIGIAAAMGAALLLWWLGNRQRGGLAGGVLAVLGAIVLAGAGVVLLPNGADAANGSAQQARAATADRPLATVPFSEARLAELRQAGTPVFLYFTADWCITCKANEAAALQRDATAQAFAKAGVVVMEGDWTRRDAGITRFLEGKGRSGVPLYLYYAPGKEGEILPQVLTTGTLTNLVS